MRFGENNVLGPKYMDMYQFRVLAGGGIVHLIFLFIIHKNEKSTRAWLILKPNSTSFRFFKKILGWRINSRKRAKEHSYIFIYESSIVVLIDFIAIFPTPGIFLI